MGKFISLNISLLNLFNSQEILFNENSVLLMRLKSQCFQSKKLFENNLTGREVIFMYNILDFYLLQRRKNLKRNKIAI